MNDEVKKLYSALLGKGYSTADLGDEETFRSKMSDKNSRKQLYDWVSSKGNFRLGDYESYENRLTSSIKQPEQPATPVSTTAEEPEVEAAAQPALTEQDKMRFSAGIAQMQRRTQQMLDESNERLETMREYREGNKLGFGQTAEGKMQYNPESGKIEKTYITPLGNRYTSKGIADMESFRYRQAADMSVSGQLRRANQKLEELKAKRAEAGNRAHDRAVKFNEEKLTTLGKLFVGGDIYRGQMQSDPESNAYDVAIRQTEELIKDLQEQQAREQGEDVGFWRGFGRVAGDFRTWDFGMNDMLDAMTMMHADKHMGDNATEGEREAYNEMMGAIHNKEQAEQAYGGNASFWNRAGMMTGHMPSFMLDFVITGGGFEGVNLLAKGGTKVATKAIGKEVVEEMAEQGFKSYVKNNGIKGFGQYAGNWTIKAMGTMGDDLLVRAPLMTNTVQLGKTTADIIDRKLGDVVVNEDGTYDFSNDKTWGSAIWQGEANSIIENYSEMFGAHLDPVVTFGNMSKLANVIGAKRIGAVLSKADAGALSGIMGQTHQLFNKMGVSDYFGEVTEEYYGQMWRTMLNLDDAYQQNPDGSRTNLLATGKFHGDIWGGMALSMGLMGAGKHTLTAANYASMKHGVNKADSHATELLGKEVWEAMRATIDLTTNDDMGAMAEAIINDKDFTPDERAAVLTYMERTMMMRGFNLATFAQSRGEQDSDVQAMNESYIDGYNMESSQEMNDAKNMLDYQRQRVSAIVDEDMLAFMDSNPMNAIAEVRANGVWNDEARATILDYLNAKQVYDGMLQRVRDDIDGRIDQSNAMVEARVNRSTGMIQGATMKVDDRRVYVVSGNLVPFADGSGIDHNASDESIIIRDAQTGALEQVSPDAVLNIDKALDPYIEKETAAEAIRQQYAQEAANKIDGVVTFNPDDTYTITGDDAQIQVQIVANEQGIVDNGDGTVNVSDGTNVFPLAKETIQQQVDEANLARLAQFEQARAEENAQVVQIAQEANRPRYNLNDVVSLTDENGTTVRGSITADADADGRFEVYTESPINGKHVNLFTSEELDAMQPVQEEEPAENKPKVRGRKQVEKAVERMRKADAEGNAIEVLNAITTVETNAKRGDEGAITPEEQAEIDALKKKYAEQGYEARDLTGKEYDEGMRLKAEFVLDESLPEGKSVIKTTIKPFVFKDGTMVQKADVIIAIGTKAEADSSEIPNSSTGEVVSPVEGVSAMERVPKDEQGNPIYEQADSDTAWDAIVEQTDGDEVMAQTVADGMVADKEAALKKLEKAKAKGGVTIAEKIAAEKERKAAIDAAKEELAIWQKIAGTANRRRMDAEAEAKRVADEAAAQRKAEEDRLRAQREEAERIEREALNGVPDMVDDTPQDARARGYRRVSGHKVDRQEPVQGLQGKEVAVKFSDNAMPAGRVAVIEAEQLQPSHIQGQRNPLHFIDEAQPKERNDEASVLSAEKIAGNIRPEEITSSVTAYTGAPTVNARGEAIQGNNRSSALRLMWETNPEQAAKYKQYLMDHAEEFGLNADDIAAMEHPVLVNMLDVKDADAITLGQFVAQDTESGGVERIKPKNALQRMGVNMRSFANLLLKSNSDDVSFAELVDNNGAEVLKWMNRKGYITATQYKSAFDSKGNLTAEAKNDLRGIMYQSIFKGGSTRLEEMFNALPPKAQKAILATAFRDFDSPSAESMVQEIQNSIRAFYALSQDADFANAKNYKDARMAVEAWKNQYQFDDATGESYLPAENFSNFALHLATMYKGENQSIIQGTFNKLYDLIQGTQEENLFEQPDNTPRTLAEAINETLNITYNGQQRSNVLAGDIAAGQQRKQGSKGDAATGERIENGERTADSAGGIEAESTAGGEAVHQPQPERKGLEQTSDVGRKANSTGVADNATQEVLGASNRGDIRVFEEGLDTSYRAYSNDSERTRRTTETERLVTIAKQHGMFIPAEVTKTLTGKVAKRTGESVVYIDTAAGKVTKVKDPYAKSAMKSGVQPEDAAFEHLVHNLLFPETEYTFEGISEEMGDVRIVLSQPFIQNYDQPTKEQIAEALAARGLFPEDNYSFGNELVSVTDVEGDNVLLGEDGTVYFIDPIIRFKKPLREIIKALGGAEQQAFAEYKSVKATEGQSAPAEFDKQNRDNVSQVEVKAEGGRRRPKGFKRDEASKPSTQELFEAEKSKFTDIANNEYAEVLQSSANIDEAVAEFERRAQEAEKRAEDWKNRKYKTNNSVVTGVNPNSGADEYSTTIGAANERRRDANVRNALNAAKQYREYAEILKERTGYVAEGGNAPGQNGVAESVNRRRIEANLMQMRAADGDAIMSVEQKGEAVLAAAERIKKFADEITPEELAEVEAMAAKYKPAEKYVNLEDLTGVFPSINRNLDYAERMEAPRLTARGKDGKVGHYNIDMDVPVGDFQINGSDTYPPLKVLYEEDVYGSGFLAEHNIDPDVLPTPGKYRLLGYNNVGYYIDFNGGEYFIPGFGAPEMIEEMIEKGEYRGIYNRDVPLKVESKAENAPSEADAPGQSGVDASESPMYTFDQLNDVKAFLGKLDATTAPAFAKRLFSIRAWDTLEEANNALKELLASYGDALHGESAAILPFLDEAQKLIADYKAAVKEPTFTEEVLENGDKRITNYNSRGEVETVATERDGKLVSVDNYDEGVLFETTTYDENGVATSVTRYDKSGNVVASQEIANARPVNRETLQLNMSEEDFNALLNSGDKAAISEYLAEMDGLLRIGAGSPLDGRDAIVKEYRGLVEQYGGEENIPADVVAGFDERIAPYNALQRAVFDRKYALQDKLREIEAKEAQAKEQAEKEAKVENKNTAFGGFLADKTDLGVSTAEKALNKKYNFDGKVMTVAEFVENAVNSGDVKLSAVEEPKYKGASRAAWNRMDAKQQEADAKKVKESGTKTVYTVNDHDLGKTAYDYAKFLQDKKAEQEKAAAKKAVENVVKPFAKKGEEPKPTTEKIEDVGEKIGGAKKDRFAEGMARIKAELEETDETLTDKLAKLPVSQVFNFDLEKLREGGISNEAISFIKIVKDYLPAKPRKTYKIRSWVNNTLALYKLCLEAGTNWDRVNTLLNGPQFTSSSLKEQFDAYMAIGGFDSGMNIGNAKLRQLDKTSGGYDENGKFVTLAGKWYVRDAGKHGGIYDTKEEAVNALKAFAGDKAGVTSSGKKKEVKFAVYQRRQDKSIFIAVKGKSDIVIQDGFKSSKEAFDYIEANNAELQERYRALLDKTNADFEDNRPREGRDYRDGKDIPAEEFRTTFGFRGVEFGNWMTQEDRRKALNECYDALMDLAAVCKVSPQALSLGGTLGMAFGARGGGRFSAHYEPGKLVINLTKTKGAGSLAHEWFHALDNYFAKMGSEGLDVYATAGEGLFPEGISSIGKRYYDRKSGQMLTEEEYNERMNSHEVRREMADAWKSLMETLKKSDYYKRSAAYAGLHNSKYWARPTELGARAFSTWVENELSKQGASNDYLANNPRFLVSEATDEQSRFMPYPFDADATWMEEAFGNLFEVMQEKTTEDGKAVLYSIAEDAMLQDKGTEAFERATKVTMDAVERLKENGLDIEVVSQEEANEMNTNRVSPLRTVGGKVYGWAVDGKIRLTPDGINPNTPVHEYAHLWGADVEKTNPKLWNKVVEAMKLSPVWNEVANDANYSDIHGNDSRMASEVLARLSGGENYRRTMKQAEKEIDKARGVIEKAEAVSRWYRIKNAISDFWNWVQRNIFNTEPKNWEDFVDEVVGDFEGKTKAQRLMQRVGGLTRDILNAVFEKAGIDINLAEPTEVEQVAVSLSSVGEPTAPLGQRSSAESGERKGESGERKGESQAQPQQRNRNMDREAFKKAFKKGGEKAYDLMYELHGGIVSAYPQEFLAYLKEVIGVADDVANIIEGAHDYLIADFKKKNPDLFKKNETEKVEDVHSLLATKGYSLLEHTMDNGKAIGMKMMYRDKFVPSGKTDASYTPDTELHGRTVICYYNHPEARLQNQYVFTVTKDNAMETPTAYELVADPSLMTPEWAEYLEKIGRKNADGTFFLDGLVPNFNDPFSLSHLMIRVNKNSHDVETISRYNHGAFNEKGEYERIAGQPNATLGNNLDKLVDGLSESLMEYKQLESLGAVPLGENMIVANDGKIYRYNDIKGGVHVGDGFWVDRRGDAHVINPGKEKLVGEFLYGGGKVKNVANGESVDIHGLKFTENGVEFYTGGEEVTETREIEIKGEKKTVTKKVIKGDAKNVITFDGDKTRLETESADSETIDSVGKLYDAYSIKGDNLKEAKNGFLEDFFWVRRIDFPNLEKAGDNCFNAVLIGVNLPKLREVGVNCFNKVRGVDVPSLPSLEKVGANFLYSVGTMGEDVNIDFPKLREVGNFFMKNAQPSVVSLPSLETVGEGFMKGSMRGVTVDLPNLTKAGYEFFGGGFSVQSFNAPKLTDIKGDFMEGNPEIRQQIMEQTGKELVAIENIEEIEVEDSAHELKDGTVVDAKRVIVKYREGVTGMMVDTNGNVLAGVFTGQKLTDVVGKKYAAEILKPGNFTIKAKEEVRFRKGAGPLTDREVVMESDVYSKVLGKPRYYGKKQREYVARQRRRMADKARQVAEKLNLDNVEVLESTEGLTGKKATSKGWFNPKTGKITVVVPNHGSTGDIVETVLHEAVAHYGLRKLFGEHFDTFLDNVFNNADEAIRRRIVELATKNGWDFRKATEEYLAMLAENTEFEAAHRTGWWQQIKDFFLNMLHKIGFEDFGGVTLTDNELRYILWRSYENLAEPGNNRSIFGEAADVAMQYDLKVGNHAVADNHTPTAAESDDELYRDGDPEIHERAMARDRYERRVKSGMFQSREAMQDSMLGLKEAMHAILGKGTNIEDVDGFENAYLGENRLSSVNKAEADAFAHTLFKPMLDEVAKLAKSEGEREELTDYMMAKHGLERNAYMRNEAIKNGDKNADKRDFAGLTALTGMDNVADAEAEAQRMVDDYEKANDTTELWKKVNAVSKAILQKLYDCGMMSKETFDKISNMYEYYIPLRGFDEKTSADAYAYLNGSRGAFNAPIKKAEGRRSKADDPFANLQSMAESAIMQGNRNKLVKHRFLNFALNHPSDLVSVSDLWLEFDAVADEWKPVFPDNIDSSDTPDVVEQKMQDFETKMEALSQSDPARYKRGKDAIGIPYRIVESRDMRQHQVIVKRNGRDYVITINGNPRAAQALNGQTNPDNDMSGAIGAILRAGEKINRQLSAFYTTRNPDFIVSNFVRDMLYTNTMAWIKESPNYAWRFHKNYLLVNPVALKRLLARYRKGTLDMSDKTDAMFYQFMMNGGETGYANIRDIEQHKNDIRKELKRAGGKLKIGKAFSLLAERFDELNRAVENCARFAAFVTSREMGRSIDRAIYDAKEISVNFNKKGSGSKFLDATGQTAMGNASAFVSGIGRSGYVFWNAAIQGTTNFGRQFKRHPAKAYTGIAAMFLLGAIVAYLGGDDDDDDKNAYYNLPEYVRRSNILFRAGDNWISIPLPIEYRAMYGMGELMTSILSGKEHLTGGEIAEAIAAQVTQILPLDFLEGGGGLSAFVPSLAKPLVEAYVIEKSWTGMPLYKDTPYNKDMPEWTKAYKSANKYIVGLASAMNEATGGDPYTKGGIDFNPAKVEYMLNGYFGGVFGTIDKLTKTAETIVGDREYDPRSFPLWNRLVKAGDERTEYRAVNNEYFRLEKEHGITRDRLRNYERDTDNGIFDYAEKIDFLYNSPEYERYEIFEDYRKDIDDLYDELKEAEMYGDEEEVKAIEAELNELKKEMIQEMNLTRDRK